MHENTKRNIFSEFHLWKKKLGKVSRENEFYFTRADQSRFSECKYTTQYFVSVFELSSQSRLHFSTVCVNKVWEIEFRLFSIWRNFPCISIPKNLLWGNLIKTNGHFSRLFRTILPQMQLPTKIIYLHFQIFWRLARVLGCSFFYGKLMVI